MAHQQPIRVQVEKKGGCLSGCGTLIVVLLVAGLIIERWEIALVVAVAALAVAWIVWQVNTHNAATAPDDAPSERACARCGSAVTTPFCPSCGAARGRLCAGCGRDDLSSAYCPDCGSPTAP